MKEIILIIGYIIIGVLFGTGFIVSEKTTEKWIFLGVGILACLVYKILINFVAKLF